jgi:signal transduction histidine kinase
LILSFQSRIVLVFSTLFVIVQLASLFAIYVVCRNNLIEQLGQNLIYAEQIFNGLLTEDGMRIAGEARILVTDFGFRTAVSDSDSATVDSALENLTYRSRANRGFYIDLSGKIISDTAGRYKGQIFMFPDALADADEHGHAVVFTILDGELCELAVVPVLAPITIGWVGIVLKVDQTLVERFKQLSTLPPDITLIEQSGENLQILTSSLANPAMEFFQQQVLKMPLSEFQQPRLIDFAEHDNMVLVRPLKSAMATQTIIAVLQIDLVKAMQAYAILIYSVVGLMVLGLLIILVGAYLLARDITQPVRQLVNASQRIMAGSFDEDVPVIRDDELGRLAETFNMANRIATEMSDLKQQDNLRRELVASVSHDLRTPLTALNGYLQTLQLKAKNLPEEEKERFLAVAVKQSEKLSRLAQELFELAKLECQAIQLQLETFNIAELIQDVFQKYHMNASQKGVRLSAEPECQLALVNADIDLIERVLTNLLDNAIRHTSAGGTVNIRLNPGNQRLAIEVSDNGEGIAPELLDKLFDRNSPLRMQSKMDAGGMGLLIVAKILALHGSDIKVQSSLGKGCVFCFNLALPI